MCGGTQTISYVFSVANPDSTKFVKIGKTVTLKKYFVLKLIVIGNVVTKFGAKKEYIKVLVMAVKHSGL